MRDQLGHIDGYSTLADDPSTGHAFRFFKGAMLDLGDLGGGYSTATGLNGRGDVVGFSVNTDLEDRAFLYTDGAMWDLTSLLTNGGWSVLGASAINDSGTIVGYAANADGVVHAVALAPAPVPEPSALAALGLGVLALRRRRR